ncbi:MAG TPA: type II toxin-antitoxin system VapC family toxin [Casimicrobiaceae bacterium]|nr:type II toxin-antitoxin system VapC family toxin [Casimicrobiaceae bacterium]
MRFWDTSALVPLLVAERSSRAVAELYRTDQHIAVAWTAAIECTSACVRQHRERRISDALLTRLLERLRGLSASWHVAEPSAEVRVGAERLVARHGLRVGDAIQLASAVSMTDPGGPAVDLVCLDRRLTLAATAEGLHVVPESAD